MDYSSYFSNYQSSNSLASMGPVGTILSLAILIIGIVATWKIFTKAGYAGWKSLIPFYNFYILCKISERSFGKVFGLCIVIILLPIISTFLMMSGNTAVVSILGIVSLVLSIWFLVEMVLVYNGLSKNFGHGAGFTVGLIFLSIIFLPILGFGSDQYIGSNRGND